MSALVAATPAQAFWGRFDPCTPGATVQVSVIDSNAAHWVCMSESAKRGDYVGAGTLLAMTAVGVYLAACAMPNGTGEGTLIAPISPGLGQVLGTIGTLAGPDAILGHEFRHLFDENFHPGLASGIDLECAH